MPSDSTHTSPRRRSHFRRLLPLIVLGTAPFLLGGCMDNLLSANCKRLNSRLLQVGANATCKFGYSQGDVAMYVVKVMSQPTYGRATGDGKYLRYEAKPGFVGTDHLRIRVVRRGVGHVQWEDLAVTVKVGAKA